MSEFKAKAWTCTPESLMQLESISKEIGDQNLSATIRYCIKFTHEAMKQKPQKKAV